MMPSTASSSLAARILASRSSRSTFRSSNLKPLNHQSQKNSYETIRKSRTPSIGGTNLYSHFSRQVRSVHSAYLRAAGSVFARKPTSNGLFPNFDKASDTSVNKSLATVLASITLQDVESAVLPVVIVRIEHVSANEKWSKVDLPYEKIS